ncbi:MAG: int8 [Ilumatobacteraceae bacterium]|nr:int8 [Ilumatobacteraceae bacterium]
MAFIKTRKTSKGEPRYDVGYRDPTGKVRRKTFRRLKDAESYKRTVEVDVIQGVWIDPHAGEVALAEYAVNWLEVKRPHISINTYRLYESELRCHILPALGDYPLVALTPSVIRKWHSKMVDAARPGPVTVAKVYRLLRSMMTTAVEDEMLLRNPCIIKGAGQEFSPERPMLSASDVIRLAQAVPANRRLLVLLGGFSGLRLGELLALRRRHVDALHGRIIVNESAIDVTGVPSATKAPKSEAGRRTVHLASELMREIEAHLDAFAAVDPEAHLFTGVRGGRLRRATWHKEWTDARKALSLTGYVFHDTRHHAGTTFSQLGATTKESMRRLGQSTPQAAMRYQHATDERDQELAAKQERLMAEAIQVAIGRL